MRESTGGDLFDHHPATMDAESSPTGSDHNFEFAFNSSNFSDRVLRIEVTAGPSESKSEGEGCSSIAEWRNRKRRREEIKKEKAAAFAASSDQILNCNQDSEEVVAIENLEGEAVAMIEELPSGIEADQSNDSSWNMDGSTVMQAKSIFISSAILAAKSPFFFKLFSNGMRESDQRHATLRINASEEAALMDLLSFIYSGKLSASSAPALLDVLMAADKFEVASCMRHCSQLLRNLPMTPESALLYLELPSSVSMASAVQPLTDAAKEYLAARYKDITKFQDEVLSLPLPGFEAILSSDDLQVASEDAVYDIVLKWVRAQYPSGDRREVLGTRLGRLIRYPFMSCRKLRKVLTCNDLDQDLASKVVLEALFFKAEAPHRQRALALEESTNRRFVERAYKYRPVKGLLPGISSRWAGLLPLCPLQHGSTELISLLWSLLGNAGEGIC
uniref:BTB/POZ domain-containing protein POB1 n=1 Tax=Anthurium amnicola TaxID=1678845 RepID=A0A1D1Y897_9ARAE